MSSIGASEDYLGKHGVCPTKYMGVLLRTHVVLKEELCTTQLGQRYTAVFKDQHETVLANFFSAGEPDEQAGDRSFSYTDMASNSSARLVRPHTEMNATVRSSLATSRYRVVYLKRPIFGR